MDNGCIPEYAKYGTGGKNGNDCTSHFQRDNLNGNVKAWVLADGSIFFQEFASYAFQNYIDINGFKGPNMPGKDVFGILIYRPKLNSNQLIIAGTSCAPGKQLETVLKESYK